MAGFRGTYKIIDKTDMALKMIGFNLEVLGVKKAVFYLDKPVSNSGRLKSKILEVFKEFDFEVECELVDNADKSLEDKDNVISSDAIVIDKSRSWINLVKSILDNSSEEFEYVDFEARSNKML